jgi:hypothetical protein
MRISRKFQQRTFTAQKADGLEKALKFLSVQTDSSINHSMNEWRVVDYIGEWVFGSKQEGSVRWL